VWQWRRCVLEILVYCAIKKDYYTECHGHKAVDAVHGTRSSSGYSGLSDVGVAACGSEIPLFRRVLRRRRRGDTARRKGAGNVADGRGRSEGVDDADVEG